MTAVCTRPRPLPAARLDRALKFEFDMPVNGERLGLADRAVSVFNRWLPAGNRGQT